MEPVDLVARKKIPYLHIYIHTHTYGLTFNDY